MRPLSAVVVLFCLAVSAAGAQETDEWDVRRLSATREMLEDLLHRLEGRAESEALNADNRAQSRRAAAVVRTRLVEGDFKVGERIQLSVEGEPQLSDTFRVEPGPRLALPLVGDISLRGVLRVEIEPHLRRELGCFVRDPVIRARALIPLSIMGEVGRPGYYTLPAEYPLTDVLMAAGGPTTAARLPSIRIERGEERVWEGAVLQQALEAGRTLGELGVQAGDRVVVPRRRAGLSYSSVRTLTLLLSIPAAVYGLTRVFD